jgi:hypothetical protein
LSEQRFFGSFLWRMDVCAELVCAELLTILCRSCCAVLAVPLSLCRSSPAARPVQHILRRTATGGANDRMRMQAGQRPDSIEKVAFASVLNSPGNAGCPKHLQAWTCDRATPAPVPRSLHGRPARRSTQTDHSPRSVT